MPCLGEPDGDTQLGVLQLTVIGFLAGLTGGMLGVGGSIVIIPAMTELFGPDQHLYQAAAMIVNFFVVVPAMYQHSRAGAIDREVVARLAPLAAIAVVIGVCISELPIFSGDGELYLCGIFGGFLMLAACLELYRLLRARPPGAQTETGTSSRSSVPRIRMRDAALVAVPTGLVAGLLGVGGGLVAVPLQRQFLRIPMRVAVANSAATIIAISLIGAAVKNYAYVEGHADYTEPFILAAILVPTAITGSLVGSRLTHALPLRIVKAVFIALLIAAAIRLMGRAVQHPESRHSQTGAPPVPAYSSAPADEEVLTGGK